MPPEPIHPAVRIGHVHLRVVDLDRAIAFYRDALGFSLTGQSEQTDTAFLAAGDYHHHIGLTASPSAESSPSPAGRARVAHVAFLYPDRREFGRAVRRLLEQGHEIDSRTDHGVASSVHLRDPDGNELELYYDRPRAGWFDADGGLMLDTDRSNPGDVLLCAHGEQRVGAPALSTRSPHNRRSSR
jgi:catechol 2,3-dioxygenase